MVQFTQSEPEALKLETGESVHAGEVVDLNDNESTKRSVRQFERLRSQQQQPFPSQNDAPYAEFRLPPEISPSLHPDNIEGQGPEVAAMRDLMGRIHGAAEKALNVCREVHRNELKTIPARHVEAEALAMRITKPAFQAYDSFHHSFAAKLEAMEVAIAAPKRPTDIAGTSDIQHARHALFRMGNKVKNDTIAHAIKIGDDITACAVLCGPAYLSGLSDQDQERWRHEWKTTRHADRAKEIENLKKQYEKVSSAAKLLQTLSFQLWSRSITDRAKKLHEAVQAAVAGVS